MDKVVITQGQADAIEYSKKVTEEDNEQIVTHHIRHQLNSNKWSSGMLMELNGLEIGTLIKALYIGYEVEEEFKAGDYITNYHGDVLRVVKVENNGVWFVTAKSKSREWLNYLTFGNKEFKKSNENEIAQYKRIEWWNKNDREVWELKKGDVIIEKSTNEKQTVERDIRDFVYPSLFEVVCFEKDRQDIAQK